MSNCVVSAKQMQSLEERYAEKSGITIQDLMDRAGQELADFIKSTTKDGNILFLCGKGNNGGDGITAARFLGDNYLCHVIIFGSKEDLSEPSKNALLRYKNSVSFSPDLPVVKDSIDKADLIIDCLFGFNFKGSIKGVPAEVVNYVNQSEKPVISADIPSGVEATTGNVNGPAIKASKTIAFSCAKLGHFLPPGSFQSGILEVSGIGIELPEKEINTFFTDIDTACDLLPERMAGIHKKTAGNVLIVAGSKEYTGAVAMAVSTAVLRAGAGYVTIAVPDSIADIVQKKVTEPIVKPMPSIKGSLSLASLDELLNIAGQSTVILIGPGLSKEKETVELACRFIDRCVKPMIIDADAINALAMQKDFKLDKNKLLTPHGGEFSRLTGKTTEMIEADRFNVSVDFANSYGTNLLLKGPNTIITNGETTYFNTTGNSGLATAGTGDILSGLIAGFAAQGMDLFEAAVLASYVHGLAADMAVSELTEYSLMATDLLSWIPKAIKRILDDGK